MLPLVALLGGLNPSRAQTVRVDPREGVALPAQQRKHDQPTQQGSEQTVRVSTLEQALALVQRWRKENAAAAIRIELAGGLHLLSRPLVLDAACSGTAAQPLIITAVSGEVAQLALAVKLSTEDFSPLNDPALLARLPQVARGQVRSLDLRRRGISVATPADVHLKHETLELIAGDRRLAQSCWPNQGYAKMGAVLDRGMAPEAAGGVFRYTDPQVLRWQHAIDDGGLWLRGFWRVPWIRQTLRVRSIDPQQQTITFRQAITGGIGSKYSASHRGKAGEESWQAINLLEEIDQPGEWAVNTQQQRLDVWLPPLPAGEPLLLATRKEPLLQCRKVAHVRIEQLSFVASLGRAVEISGGEDVRIAGCTFRNSGDCAIAVTGGLRHQIRSNDISAAGREGIRCFGGERRTLQRCDHLVENNWIHHIGVHAPVPAVVIGESTRAEAVGVTVRHNRIHDVPNSGIVFGGNEHLIEENELYRLGLGSNDLGGIYTNSAWTARGTVIRHNWIHHSPSANGIYMDDGSCGSRIEGNVIWHCASGVFIGGGHDQLVSGNIALNCERAVHVDSRGVSRNYTRTNPFYAHDLDSVPYEQELWRSRYPALVNMLLGDTRPPSGVVLELNRAIDCAQGLRMSGKERDFAGVQRGTLIELSDSKSYVDETSFQLHVPALEASAASSQLAAGPTVAIDTARWGLQRDVWRRELPTRDVAELRRLDAFAPFDSQLDVDASNRHPSAPRP